MRKIWSGMGSLLLAASLALALGACGADEAEAPDDTAAVEEAASEGDAAEDALESEDAMESDEEAEDEAGMEDEVTLPSVTFVATDYAIEGPSSLPAGMTEVRLDNEGTELHHVQIALLDEGKTLDDVGAFMAENPGAEPDFVTMMGGPNAIMPGTSGNAYVDLVPGDYVLLCVIPSPDGVPHSEKGMVAGLTVTEAEEGAAMAEAPEADLTIVGKDFGFELPEEPITAGDHTINFVNEGEQVHEIVVVALDEGATIEDFAAAFGPDAPPGPPPGRTLGGTVGIEPGMSQSFDVTIGPGNHALICFLPDSASGAPHFAMGMTLEFAVE